MDWLEILGQVFELLIFPALIAASGYLVSWIHAKKEELKLKTKNETTNKYIDMLDRTISECVVATTQTYVDALKKEGRFDGEAQKVAFQKTFDAVMDILTDDAKEYLGEAVKDLNACITNKIEANVKYSK
jgi:hypothetical protein